MSPPVDENSMSATAVRRKDLYLASMFCFGSE